MRNMTELSQVLDRTVANIAECTDDELDVIVMQTERAYIHAWVEKGLRYHTGVSPQAE